MIDTKPILTEAQQRMDKAVTHAQHEFGTLHTGKATPTMVEGVQVHIESYGATMHLRDIATITTPDARHIVVTPWDKNVLKEIEKAILTANLGLNPAIHGNMVRVPVPELSGERRQELVKVAHRMSEEARISIRQTRHHALEALKKAEKAGQLSEDDLKRCEKDVQNMTDKHINLVNTLLSTKEKELTTV